MPAHFCGIAGLKPTPGRISGAGHTPSLGYPAGLVTTASASMASQRALDLRLLFSVLAGYDGQDPFSVPAPLRHPELERVRIGVWEQFYTVPVDPEIRAAVRSAASLAANAGFTVDAFEPRGMERAPNLWELLLRSVAGQGEGVDRRRCPAESGRARPHARRATAPDGGCCPQILMPVFGIPAFRHGEKRNGPWTVREIGLFQAGMPCIVANVLGLPAVTIPIAVTAAGLPVGVQLMGRPFDDELVMELAIRIEDARA